MEFSEMQKMVGMMYEEFRTDYPDALVERGYDRAVEVTLKGLRDDYDLDLQDGQVKQICIRFYAALCVISASASDDGLDDWLGIALLGAALGVPEE